jgi:ubiquinone biosynthesis protein COQ4
LGDTWRIISFRIACSLDERDNVKYIDDEELAYVMLRYRQEHDSMYALLGLPATYREIEFAVKAFE